MNNEIKAVEYDLCGFVCPLSKMKAAEAVNALNKGETLNIVLGDTESLKSVAQELKDKGIKPSFKQDGENRFILTITK
jgi:TusA-related sulfurtransferase